VTGGGRREPGRRRKAQSPRTETVDVAEEPGELDRKATLKLESMSLERCVRGMAYERRLALQGIWQRKDVEEALKLFGSWCAWVRAMREQTGELLEPMARVAG
jgi:hypothetical protein